MPELSEHWKLFSSKDNALRMFKFKIGKAFSSEKRDGAIYSDLYVLIGVEADSKGKAFKAIEYQEGYASCRIQGDTYGIRVPDSLLREAEDKAIKTMRRLVKRKDELSK